MSKRVAANPLGQICVALLLALVLGDPRLGGGGFGAGPGAISSHPSRLYSQHQFFLSGDQPACQLSRPAVQSKGQPISSFSQHQFVLSLAQLSIFETSSSHSKRQPLCKYLQHQIFLSTDQPVSRFSNPSSQSK